MIVHKPCQIGRHIIFNEVNQGKSVFFIKPIKTIRAHFNASPKLYYSALRWQKTSF